MPRASRLRGEGDHPLGEERRKEPRRRRVRRATPPAPPRTTKGRTGRKFEPPYGDVITPRLRLGPRDPRLEIGPILPRRKARHHHRYDILTPPTQGSGRSGSGDSRPVAALALIRARFAAETLPRLWITRSTVPTDTPAIRAMSTRRTVSGASDCAPDCVPEFSGAFSGADNGVYRLRFMETKIGVFPENRKCVRTPCDFLQKDPTRRSDLYRINGLSGGRLSSRSRSESSRPAESSKPSQSSASELPSGNPHVRESGFERYAVCAGLFSPGKSGDTTMRIARCRIENSSGVWPSGSPSTSTETSGDDSIRIRLPRSCRM